MHAGHQLPVPSLDYLHFQAFLFFSCASEETFEETAPSTMPTKIKVSTDKAPPPLPYYSQAIICNGMVYCSGSLGMNPETKTMVDSGIGDRTVSSEIVVYDTEENFVAK